MNYNIPFWCVKTSKRTIVKKLSESNLWVQLIKLICEEDIIEYEKRLLVFAKECTFLYLLVYQGRKTILKPATTEYKKLLFDNWCESEQEMKCRLKSFGIEQPVNKVFLQYKKITTMLAKILSRMCYDRIHCVELVFYIDYIIQRQGNVSEVVIEKLVPINLPPPPKNFLPDEFII